MMTHSTRTTVVAIALIVGGGVLAVLSALSIVAEGGPSPILFVLTSDHGVHQNDLGAVLVGSVGVVLAGSGVVLARGRR
jgi:hypothetical protein